MARKDKDSFDIQEFDITEPEPTVVDPVRQNVVVKPMVEVKQPKLLSFEQWASRTGVKKHHMRGLKAFIPSVNRSRTLEEWNTAVKGY